MTKSGLTAAEVAQRMADGRVNGTEEIQTKSIGQILLQNLLTPFNLLNAVLAAMVLSVGSYKNALFLGVIFLNTLIGTVQEIRAKKLIDRLKLITAPKATVVRDGEEQTIAVAKLVLDDWMLLRTGQQVCADALVQTGTCEVNEALITGESDPIVKHPGDALLSGSFVVSGACEAQVEHVGKDNYAAKMTGDAKYLKRPDSELMQGINGLIKTIGFVLIPVGIALFTKQMLSAGDGYAGAIVTTVAALVGMIPEGLVLLTSVVLAVGVMRLARRQALVQELYSIEMLARVDTLCLDKTGTITEGRMQVDEILPLTEEDWRYHLSTAVSALDEQNPTAEALREFCGQAPDRTVLSTVAFSSSRKWSGVSFADGTVVFGAGEFVLGDAFSAIRTQTEEAADRGQRVLVLAISPNPFQDQTLPANLQPIALLLLSDRMRENAKETLSFFAEQGVDIKIISGDNARTVSHIAARAGLKTADHYVDATTLPDEEALQQAAKDYSVFGRVTPQQKLQLVRALKNDGKTVAMTGDGVNDVLALRESDCSIAMAAGSDAARTVSQIVLLDSDFASMPHIVAEGRRSINNLQRSASLFLVKTFFSAILAVLFIFLPFSYPFQPIQFTLISALTIGAPSFILALEPNRERIQGRFLTNIIQRALPGSLTMVVNMLALLILTPVLSFSPEQISTLAVLVTGYTGLLILVRVCIPFTPIHTALCLLMTAGFVSAYLLFPSLFSMVSLTLPMMWALLPLLALALGTQALLFFLSKRWLEKRAKHENKKV